MKNVTTEKLMKMTADEFLAFTEETIRNAPTNLSGIFVKFPYDLRTHVTVKTNDCNPYYKWTAFVNNSGTLCHVVAGETGMWMRIKFTYPIKHLNIERMNTLIQAQTKDWLVL